MTRPYYAGSPDFGKIVASFNSPKYDELSVAAAAGLSRLENERIKLLAQTKGLQELIGGQVAGAKLKAAGQDSYAESQTNNATKMAVSEVLGSALGSIKMPGSGSPAAPMKVAPGWSGGDTTGVSYDDVLSMSGDKDYTNTIMNGGAMEWSSEWP